MERNLDIQKVIFSKGYRFKRLPIDWSLEGENLVEIIRLTIEYTNTFSACLRALASS